MTDYSYHGEVLWLTSQDAGVRIEVLLHSRLNCQLSYQQIAWTVSL